MCVHRVSMGTRHANDIAAGTLQNSSNDVTQPSVNNAARLEASLARSIQLKAFICFGRVRSGGAAGEIHKHMRRGLVSNSI